MSYDNTNRGVLFKNDRKEEDRHPDYKGKINANGQDFELAAWIREDRNGRKYMSLSVSEPWVDTANKASEVADGRSVQRKVAARQPAPKQQQVPLDEPAFNDEIPF